LIARDEILEHVLVADLIRWGHSIDEEDPFEVIVLVLNDSTRKACELLFVFNPVNRMKADLAAVRPTDLCIDAGEGEAPLLIGRLIAAALEDLWIDQDAICALFTCGVHDEDSSSEAYLRRGEPDTVRGVHAGEHTCDDPCELVVERLDRLRGISQHRLGIEGEFVLGELFGHNACFGRST